MEPLRVWFIKPEAFGSGEFITKANLDWRRDSEIDSVLVVDSLSYKALQLKVRKLEAELQYLKEKYL